MALMVFHWADYEREERAVKLLFRNPLVIQRVRFLCGVSLKFRGREWFIGSLSCIREDVATATGGKESG
jgi:hypothetical protein